MIYPTLIINDNKDYNTINFIDTEFEDVPFLSIDFPKEDSFEIFFAFYISFLDAYNMKLMKMNNLKIMEISI